jgi:intracellular sulfur oxidation DsrE/DsrF family protein
MFRRAFLSRLPVATALFTARQPTPSVAAPPAPSTGSARHAQDDWLDQAPRKHRVVFDTWLADRFGEAAAFAANWIRINKEQYELTDADLAVVIVARHGTAPFAFNDAIWAKYGKIFADNMSTRDKVARPNPTTNVHAARLATMSGQCLRLAVCALTTRGVAGTIARETGGERDAIYKELTSNMIGRAQLVPAGIVAATRAQEYGYAMVTIA